MSTKTNAAQAAEQPAAGGAPPASRLNGHKRGETLPLTPPSEIETKRQQLREHEEALAREREQLEREEAAALETARQRKIARRDDLLADAQAYRQEAAQQTDPSLTKILLQSAAESVQEANRLAAELGLSTEVAPEPEAAPTASRQWLLPILQLTGLLTVIVWCYGRFFALRDEINAINARVEPFAQIRPYNLDAIQKLVYEKLVVATDLLMVLGIIAIVAPRVLLYLLPFVRSEKDFSADFQSELTAWQRTIISVALVSLVLLYLGLSHSVKP